MRRSRQVYSMFPPEIYTILKQEEPNVSLYIFDLVCANLIARGKLTTKKLLEVKTMSDEEVQRAERHNKLTPQRELNVQEQ